MEISFEGSPKEIIALLVKLQGQTGNVLKLIGSINDEELKKLQNKDEPQQFHIITEDEIPGPYVGEGIFYEPYPQLSEEESGTPIGENPRQPQTKI